MKRANLKMENELRSEYDLHSLRVRKLGSGRKAFGGKRIRLDPGNFDLILGCKMKRNRSNFKYE